MLGIKRLDHVSMAAQDMDGQIAFWRDLFGMEVVERFDSRAGGFSGAALSIPGSPTQLEVLAPLGRDSFLARFLAAGGSALHHLTFEVHDLDAAAAALRGRGIEPFGQERRDDWYQLFIHPRDTGGVLVQLYQQLPPAKDEE